MPFTSLCSSKWTNNVFDIASRGTYGLVLATSLFHVGSYSLPSRGWWNSCSACDREFVDRHALEQHWANSSNHSWCRRCDEFFDSEKDLENHKEYSMDHWICEKCCLDFTSEENLHEHYSDDPDHNWCFSCGMDFSTPNSLTQVRQGLSRCLKTHVDEYFNLSAWNHPSAPEQALLFVWRFPPVRNSFGHDDPLRKRLQHHHPRTEPVSTKVLPMEALRWARVRTLSVVWQLSPTAAGVQMPWLQENVLITEFLGAARGKQILQWRHLSWYGGYWQDAPFCVEDGITFPEAAFEWWCRSAS